MMARLARTRMETVTLYTRRGCKLCDEMKAELGQRGYDVHEVDIDQDPELISRYGHDIPVVVRADGTELVRHRFKPDA